jgi:hypothetical protein
MREVGIQDIIKTFAVEASLASVSDTASTARSHADVTKPGIMKPKRRENHRHDPPTYATEVSMVGGNEGGAGEVSKKLQIQICPSTI